MSTTPSINPGAPVETASSGAAQPTAFPPTQAGAKSGCGCGGGGSAESAAAVAAPMAGDALSNVTAPSLRPNAAASVTAWQNTKKINALWSINQDRNSWIHVDGIGWRRLSAASVSGITSLTMLAASAREKDSVVNLREEADGMVHEMYVF